MKRAKLIWIIFIGALLLPFTWIVVSNQFFKHRSVVATIESLDSKDVDRVLVYEGDWPRGEPRVVEDAEKIKFLVYSLKTGKRYLGNHDQRGEFERVVFIEPQNLQFRVYQRKGDKSSVIVGLGEWTGPNSYRSFGDIQCSIKSAWTQL